MSTPFSSPTAPKVLLTGPAGSGKTHRALDRIRLAATTPGERGRGAAAPGSALLVLPTYSQALHLERVALSRWDARAILDDPFATFTSAGERFLDGFRVRALPTAVERDGLMHEALHAVDAPGFAAVRDATGLRARLLRLVKEAKQSGLAPPEVRRKMAAGAAALEGGAQERLTSFLAVFEAYDRLLERAGLEDHEDTLRRLLEELRTRPPARPPASLVVDGFDDFTPVEQGILDALCDAVSGAGGEVLVTLPWDEARPSLFAASAPARRHLLGCGFVEEALVGFPRAPGTGMAALARGLFSSAGTAATDGLDDPVRLVVAGDPEDEAETLARHARRAYDDGTLVRGWRDLGVIVRRLDGAGPRIRDAFHRLGIPVRMVSSGEPLVAAPLVRAFAGPLRLLGGQATDAAALLAWLRWRAWCGVGGLAHVDALEIRWRRHGYPSRWEGLLEDVRTAQLPVDDLAEHAKHLRTVSDRGARHVWPALDLAIRALAPLPLGGGLGGDGRVLDPNADGQRTHAAAALARLLALVEGFGSAAGRTGLGDDVDAARAVRMLLDSAEQTELVLPDRRLDAVNVMDAEEARYWELAVVFVAGLAQGRFPLHPREDVLLRDDEREALRARDGALSLPLARDREVRERRLFYGAVTRARKRTVLFRPAFDAGGGVQSASPFLRDVERVLPALPMSEARPAGRPAPEREECWTPRDWGLFAAAHVGDGDASLEDRKLAAALLARGAPDLRHRAARWGRTEADPLPAGGSWKPRFGRSVARVSATSIRTALACRYRFFLRSVVGIPEDDAPFAGPDFGARELGALVHAVLERAVLEKESTPEEVVANVMAAAEAKDTAVLAPQDPVDRLLEAEELVRVVRLMRRREEVLARPLEPLPDGLEWAFGEKEGVTLEHGGRVVSLRGYVDRLDGDEKRVVVIDYKLATSSAKNAYKAMREGLDPQLALYAAVVARKRGLRVVGLEWVAALQRARYGLWLEDAMELAGNVKEEQARIEALDYQAFSGAMDDALDRTLDTVEALRGLDHALQHEDPKRCGACAWRTVCRPRYGHVVEEDDE